MDPQGPAEEVLPEWVTAAELEAQRAIEIGEVPEAVKQSRRLHLLCIGIPSPESLLGHRYPRSRVA